MMDGRKKQEIDLSDIRLLHCGVDTVKQLYSCILKADIYESLNMAPAGSVVHFGGVDWALSRSSKQSGYQYILKNLEEGFVVLLKSFYKDIDEEGSHIKVEVSPHVIYKNDPDSLTRKIRFIASLFADNPRPTGCAVHLAVDIKNFNVPEDFESRFVCKAKREAKFNSISAVTYETLNEISCVYGDRQTFTYGQPSAVQFTMYDKAAEIEKRDKQDFWHMVWSAVPDVDDFAKSEFMPGDSVRRIEVRLHHSVIAQFARGTQGMEEYAEHPTFKRLEPHLNALWRYALDNFRLQHSYRYVDPIWQLLHEDVVFNSWVTPFFYRREFKTPSVNSRRNVAFFIGNYLRLAARRQFTVKFVTDQFLAMGIEAELSDYFGLPTFGAGSALFLALNDFVSRRLTDLQLQGVAA